MEDSWICIETDDDTSNHHSSFDSDQIDSETEAELYSKIHYEENLASILNCPNSDYVNAQSSELFVSTPYKITGTFYTDEKKENMKMHPKSKNENMNINHSSKVNLLNLDKEKLSDISVISKKFPAKKRKSDSLETESNLMLWSKDSQEGNLIELSKHESTRKRNKKAKLSYNAKQKPSNQNDTIVIDSSDSDSNFVWTEQDSSKNDFKINMLGDIEPIYLSSSDSDSESNFSAPYMKNYSFLKNLSMPNMKLGENSKDLWHINNEDLRRQKKSRRYHENIDITCSNCSRKGHTHRTCLSPKIIKCFICGGPHVGAKCMNRMCSNCYGFGHDRRRCQKKGLYNLSCNLCYMQGHLMENCPDLWRRYHLTTKTKKIKKGPLLKKEIKQNIHLYCWNCGRKGHFGAECPIPNFSRSCFPTWPCVISYGNPGGLLRRRFNKPLSRFSSNNDNNVNQSRNNNIPVTITDNNRITNFTPGQELNHVENVISARTKKNKKRMDMRFNRVHQIVTQKDFPRTPKKKSPRKFEDSMPESVNMIAKKNKRKNRKKNKLERRKAKLQLIKDRASELRQQHT